MLTDFFSAYRVLKDILHAWCWAHMRRKFIDAARGYQQLKDWSERWVDRIGELYHLNDIRLATKPDSPEWAEAEVPAQAVCRRGDLCRLDQRTRRSHPPITPPGMSFHPCSGSGMA